MNLTENLWTNVASLWLTYLLPNTDTEMLPKIKYISVPP